jgi:hypothetical protein
MTRRMPHQFRFQLIAKWLAETYSPRKALDVGGGKGLLAYLLNQNEWQVKVVDPVDQKLNWKFKDLVTGKRVKIENESVPRITEGFSKELAEEIDLLIGLHAHGSNMAIIEAAAERQKDFVLFPCCVVDEPIEKRANVNWMDSLEEYAKSLGHEVKRVKLNFVGQDIGLYTARNRD